jgi:hypothetical protein
VLRPFICSWPRTFAFLAAAIFLLWPGAAERRVVNANAAMGDSPDRPASSIQAKCKRVREGTKIEKTGYFRITGDRVTFYTDDGKTRYRGLENLMLERIGRTIEDNPGQLQWHVSGTVTEYRAANYLLVTHAVLKTNENKSPAKRRSGPAEQ